MCYVDTSVIVAMLTNESKAQVCYDWFAHLTQAPQSADWLITEFNSAIALKLRTQQLQPTQTQAILNQFQTLISGGIYLLPVGREVFSQAGSLTLKHHSLRAGDALHLSVAQLAGLKTFVTLDNAQASAATALGFQVESL